LTISLRLTCWLSGVFLVGFIIFGIAMWLDLAYYLSQGRDKTITTRARRLEDLLDKTRAETAERRSAKFDDFAQATPEGNLIQVFDDAGQRIYPAHFSSSVEFPWPKREASRDPQFSDVQVSGRHYRVTSRVLQLDGRTLLIYAAGQLEDNRLLLRRFSTGLLWSIPVSLALSAMFGYFLSRRALDPVARLISSARAITIGNLSRRLPLSSGRDELHQLAQTCNEMLARLEEAVNQITRFTADASHELRSPISFIRTTAECGLRNPELDPESAQSFRDIVAESDQAARLLDDMLTLARSDAGHADTAFETIDLAEVVAEVCGKIQTLAETKRHSLTADIAVDGSALITGDGPSLRRLIWILLDNAIKYTPSGGTIQVGLDLEEGEARMSVRDSGVGIPAASLPHLFERFYRIDASRANEEGTGLGLAIAKWIIDIHHATISVESLENKGTRFLVRFRLA
jgi:heavy metal sensor kinase